MRPSLLAAALAGRTELVSPGGRHHAPRPYCAMGICRECETLVDGVVVAACLEADR